MLEQARRDEEKLSRFGHHPDPVTDYGVEVEWLEGAVLEMENGVRSTMIERSEVMERASRVSDFRVGGTVEGLKIRTQLNGILRRLESLPPRSTKTDTPNSRTFVPDALERIASIYRDRNGTYGDNYLHAGKVLLGLFPRGIALETEEDFNRFHLVVHLASKLSRYCMTFQLAGRGHADSMDDMSVYAQMANEFDALTAEKS